MKKKLLASVTISSAVESCKRKQLKIAASRGKKHLSGTKMIKQLSKQREMLFRPCCKTCRNLICNPGIPNREKLQLRQ